jgi:hypothetical protein
MIYPTLFIGLGSTGLDILERFQEMVLEHYGRASLDIFRYIAIETREGAEISRSDWGENEIKLLKPVIRNTDAIKNAIKSDHRQYLAEWLNPELLKIDGGQFTDGASNIRMAGRLILWENWNEIKAAITQAYTQTTSDANIKVTRVFLRNHYARHGQSIDNKVPLIGDLPNIYIVGTLCGGTCSGMFIDIAYYTKQITGLWARNLPNPHIAKIMGVFTLFDAATLNDAQQEGVRLHAANSWAALKEYDFYCHPQTRYQTTFPDGTCIDTNERPIDYPYLLSCTATDCTNQLGSNLRNRDGSPNLDSLDHMAATLLYTETVGTLLEKKASIRTDYRSRARAIERNTNEHSPCIATCGIATIWYPKYRIALGTACKYGASLCREWLGEVDPNTRKNIEKDIPKEWFNLLSHSVDELTSSPTGSIMDDVKQKFDKNRDKYISLQASQFKEYFQEQLGLLNKGKKYDDHISDRGRVSIFKDKLTKELYNLIANAINTKLNLAYTEYSLKHFDKAIANTIERLPSEYPTPDLSKVEGISSDVFSKLIFKGKEAESQRKEEILDDVKEYIINHIKTIRNFVLRPILEEIREEIGTVKSLPKDRTDAEMLTLKQHIDNMKTSLSSCIKYLDRRYEDLGGDLVHTEDVRVVSQGTHETISDDIDQLAAYFQLITPAQKDIILSNIKGGRSLSQFLGFGSKDDISEEVKKKMVEQLVHETLQQVGTFDVVDHVLKNWTASDIAEFAKHGLPHLELTPGHSGLASVTIGRPVSLIVGGNATGLGALLDDKLSGTSCEGLFGRNQKSPVFLPELSHIVVFYREEPLMYMDDNLATATLFEECYQDAERTSVYGLYTHKGGQCVFDPRIYARRDKAKNELMPIATHILSSQDEKGKWISSDIFGIEKGRLILRDARKSGLKFRLTGDENGVELCAQEEEIFEYFHRLMEEKLNNMTKDEFIIRVNNHLEWIEKKADDEGKDPTPIIEEERRKIMKIRLIRDRFFEETAD